LSNWAAGGDDFSLALTSYINYYLFYKKGRHTWDNNVDFNIGYIKTTSLGARKNDDRIDIVSKYGIRVDTSNKVFVSGLFNLRTQLFNGFTYYGDSGVLTSAFLSPGYLLLSVGIDYKPFENFSVFLSPITSRYTLMRSERLYYKGLYGVLPFHKYVSEVGAFASVNFFKPIFKNVTYKGRTDLFSNYQNKPFNIDIFFTNLFTFKINKYLSATYSLDMIYDDDVKLFGKKP